MKDYAIAIANEDKNTDEEIVTTGKELLQFVPAIVEKPPLWIGSTFFSSSDLFMPNIQHVLGLA